jgi:hypothetical protein
MRDNFFAKDPCLQAVTISLPLRSTCTKEGDSLKKESE